MAKSVTTSLLPIYCQVRQWKNF